MFSKMATKIDKIFTVDLTVTTYCQIDDENFVNFCGHFRKHELYHTGTFYQIYFHSNIHINSEVTVISKEANLYKLSIFFNYWCGIIQLHYTARKEKHENMKNMFFFFNFLKSGWTLLAKIIQTQVYISSSFVSSEILCHLGGCMESGVQIYYKFLKSEGIGFKSTTVFTLQRRDSISTHF